MPPDLNPADEHESERLLALHELTVGPPDQQSLELARSLLDTNLAPDGSALEQRAGHAVATRGSTPGSWPATRP